jgi:DNA-binding IscR family transcriptional regulator
LVLTAGTVEIRRQLGPTAWVVFEELLLSSTDTPDECVAAVSIRALAGRLGVSKDTVARAIGRLRRAGLVNAHQSRRDSGVFATGSYTLTIPPTVAVTDHTDSASSTASRSASQSTRPMRHRDQLALTLTT